MTPTKDAALSTVVAVTSRTENTLMVKKMAKAKAKGIVKAKPKPKAKAKAKAKAMAKDIQSNGSTNLEMINSAMCVLTMQVVAMIIGIKKPKLTTPIFAVKKEANFMMPMIREMVSELPKQLKEQQQRNQKCRR